MDALVVVVVVLLVAAAALVLRVLLVVGRAAQRGRERAAGLIGDGERVLRQGDASSFGQESLGVGQARGNGTLVLTDRALLFAMWLPARSLRIPLHDVVAVDTVRGHLGKTRGVRLLYVRWRTGEGVDAVAWQVPDLDGWLSALGAPTDQ